MGNAIVTAWGSLCGSLKGKFQADKAKGEKLKLIKNEIVKGVEIKIEVGQKLQDGRIPYYVKKNGEIENVVYDQIEADNFYNLTIAFARM